MTVMKKVFTCVLMALILLGCAKKKDAMLAAYEKELAKLETVLDNESEDEAEMESAIADITAELLALAEKSEQVALRLFEDKVTYFLSLDQKARLFASVTMDSLEAHGLGKAYVRYLGEQNTQAGKPMIDIVCATPKGDSLHLADIVAAHDFVLLDFWASWCRPCRELMPELKEIYAAHKGKRLEIVSISIDKDLEAWKAMIEKLDLPWLHGAAQLAREGTEPADVYGINYIPTLFLIGHDGTIIAREPELKDVEEKLTSEN